MRHDPTWKFRSFSPRQQPINFPISFQKINPIHFVLILPSKTSLINNHLTRLNLCSIYSNLANPRFPSSSFCQLGNGWSWLCRSWSSRSLRDAISA
ncbi:Uncharacterized protein TCM_034981 [Theobroma cacao]|uniref:Uncharacterized protein n=1 Tax=Theobroma cacao TaxID=3641 RepID=A0A061FNL0_THECC|nr:Uncharacterized protein TCM_034981 [Theobroma cacao]